MPGIKQNVDVIYNDEKHWAPPVSIQWATAKSKRLYDNDSIARWVFIRCCGAIGMEERGVIKSVHSCKKTRSGELLPVTNKHHNGKLRLLRTTRSQVKTRKPPLAVWSCCREQILNWQDCWHSRDHAIPFELVDSGCQYGKWDDDVDSSYDDNSTIGPFARVAKKKSSMHSNKRSSHDQTVIINHNLELNVINIKICQNSVKTKFTDGRHLFHTMQDLWSGKISITNLPKIRVAKRNDQYYSSDSRRLFMFKALGIETIQVEEIAWMAEFDNKLQQNPVLKKYDPHRFRSDDFISLRNYFMHYLRSTSMLIRLHLAFSSFDNIFSEPHDDSYRIAIPIKLQEEMPRKFYFRYTRRFLHIMRKYKEVNFDIPKIGKQPLTSLSCLPLTLGIKEDYRSKDDNKVIFNVIRDIEKFVNRLWKRYHDEELFYNKFELNDENELQYMETHMNDSNEE